MLAFTDDLLKAGLEGDTAARNCWDRRRRDPFTSCKKCASTPSQFHAFRGPLEPLDGPRTRSKRKRLQGTCGGDVSHSEPPLDSDQLPDAVTVRGFIYDVDTGSRGSELIRGPWEDRLTRRAPSADAE